MDPRKNVILYVANQVENSDAWMHWSSFEESLGNVTFAMTLYQMADKFKLAQRERDERRFSIQYMDSYYEKVQERNVIRFLGRTPEIPYDRKYPVENDPPMDITSRESIKRRKFLREFVIQEFSPTVILKYAPWEYRKGNIDYAYGLTWFIQGMLEFKDAPEDVRADVVKLGDKLWSESFRRGVKTALLKNSI